MNVIFFYNERFDTASLHSSFLVSSSLVHMLLQLPSRDSPIQSLGLLVLGTEVDANAVHTMPLVLGIAKALALEDMPKMSTTVVAHDLGPHHAQAGIGSLANSARHGVPEGGPAAA
jgi:hypothetical protein